MTTNTTASIDLDKLEALARAATPQLFDSAELERKGGTVECPLCHQEGYVEIEADYCNYDAMPIGAIFYGIGKEVGAAEAYYRAANPATVLQLIELARRSTSGSDALEYRTCCEHPDCSTCAGRGGFYRCKASGSDGTAAAELPPLPTPLEIDWPELHSQALGCGVEDRGIRDRYEAAEYGWQYGLDKAVERVPETIYDAEQMREYGAACYAIGRGAAVRDYISPAASGSEETQSVELADERALFEAAFRGHPNDRNMPDKSYNSPFLHVAWQGWQARAALAQQTGAPIDLLLEIEGAVAGWQGMLADEIRQIIAKDRAAPSPSAEEVRMQEPLKAHAYVMELVREELRPVLDEIRAAMSQAKTQGTAALSCETCGADRSKERCKAEHWQRCPMMGQAHVAGQDGAA